MLQYSSKILIEFDMIFDLDAGIIRTINDKYCDENIFFKEITDLDDHLLCGTLKKRSMKNPLQIAFRDESMIEEMDSIYNQLMEQDYESIVDNAIPTNIFNLVGSFILTDGITCPTILCTNYYQRKVCCDLFSDYEYDDFKIVLNQKDKIDVKGFTDIFVKDIDSLLKYENLDGMNVYLADLNINYENEVNSRTSIGAIPKQPYGIIFDGIIKMHYIEMYSYDNSYFFDEDYQLPEEPERDEKPGLKNNSFIKSILGDEIIDEAYSTIKLDEYNKEEDPYYESDDNSEEEDFRDFINGIDKDEFPEYYAEVTEGMLEEGDVIPVDDSVEFAPGYKPEVYHEPEEDEDDEEEWEDNDDDFDPEDYIPNLLALEQRTNEIRNSIMNDDLFGDIDDDEMEDE